MPSLLLPKSVILIRHGHGEDDALSRKERIRDKGFSTHNCKLTEQGRKQVKLLRKWLIKNYTFDRYFASYYIRVLETFGIAYPNIQPTVDARLIELRRGVEDLITLKQIDKLLPWNEIKRRKREGPYNFRPLNGESWSDVEIRLRSFFLTLQLECPNENVVIFGHGKTRAIIENRILGNLSCDKTIEEYGVNPPENASVTVYERKQSKLVLKFSNFVPWKK